MRLLATRASRPVADQCENEARAHLQRSNGPATGRPRSSVGQESRRPGLPTGAPGAGACPIRRAEISSLQERAMTMRSRSRNPITAGARRAARNAPARRARLWRHSRTGSCPSVSFAPVVGARRPSRDEPVLRGGRGLRRGRQAGRGRGQQQRHRHQRDVGQRRRHLRAAPRLRPRRGNPCRVIEGGGLQRRRPAGPGRMRRQRLPPGAPGQRRPHLSGLLRRRASI